MERSESFALTARENFPFIGSTKGRLSEKAKNIITSLHTVDIAFQRRIMTDKEKIELTRKELHQLEKQVGFFLFIPI